MDHYLPQILIIILFSLGIGLEWANHGTAKNGTHDVWNELISTLIVIAILWWGGFWQ